MKTLTAHESNVPAVEDAPDDNNPMMALEYERALVSSLFLEGGNMPLVADTLTAEDFAQEDTAILYDAMLSLHKAGKHVDGMSIKQHLTHTGQLDKLGGLVYLAKLGAVPSNRHHIETYMEGITAASIRRRLAAAGDHIRALASQPADDPLQLLDMASKHLSTIEGSAGIGERQYGADATNLAAWFEAHEAELMARADKDAPTGLTTGLESLNNVTGGLQKGDLVLVGASTSVGKTTLAQNMALAALKDGRSVMIVSLEMSKERLWVRLLSLHSGVDSELIRSTGYGPEDRARVLEANRALCDAGSSLRILDRPDVTISRLRAEARSHQARTGLDLLIVDYLQLMETGTRGGYSRAAEVGEISKGLKRLALELKIPVVALSQLNREAASKAGSGVRPGRNDLRESGSIENDSDVVILLHRESMAYPIGSVEYEQAASEYGMKYFAELLLVKQRDGEANIRIDVRFDPATLRFSDADQNDLDHINEYRAGLRSGGR